MADQISWLLVTILEKVDRIVCLDEQALVWDLIISFDVDQADFALLVEHFHNMLVFVEVHIVVTLPILLFVREDLLCKRPEIAIRY